MLYFSVARTIFNRNSTRARSILKEMKNLNRAYLNSDALPQENLFTRTGKVVPEQLKLYYSSAQFDWHRTWSSASCNVGSPRTLLIKGRHYAHFRNSANREQEDAAEIKGLIQQRRQEESMFLFLVSFSMSSLLVFIAALIW